MTDGLRVSALIVEDEPLARRLLKDLIRATPWLECVGEVSDGRLAAGAIDHLQPDLVFLDVQLPGRSGLDVLSAVTVHPAVIFTTAFDQYAVSAFELGAIDYLLKPFGAERFERAVTRAKAGLIDRQRVPAAMRARDVMDAGPLRRLFARDAERIVPIPTSAIERIEANDDFVLVHTGGRSFRLNATMASIEARLDARTFVRVHRSHVVNLDHVVAIEPYDGSRFQVTLRSGAKLLASRQRSRALRQPGR